MCVEAKIGVWSRLPENLENKHVIFLIDFLLKSNEVEPPINCSWIFPNKSLAARKTITWLEVAYTNMMGQAPDMWASSEAPNFWGGLLISRSKGRGSYCLQLQVIAMLITDCWGRWILLFRNLYIHGPLASEPQVAGVTRTGERPFDIPGFSPAGMTRRCGALRHSRV